MEESSSCAPKDGSFIRSTVGEQVCLSSFSNKATKGNMKLE